MAGKQKSGDEQDKRDVGDTRSTSIEALKETVEKIPTGVAISTLDGKVLYRNRASAFMRGFISADDAAKNLPDATRSYYDLKDRERFLELLSKGPVTDFETRLRRNDGTPFWASINAKVEKIGPGDAVIITVTQDIDARKGMEKQLRDMAKFPEENPNPTFRVTKDGIITQANKSSRTLIEFWNTGAGKKVPDDFYTVINRAIWSGNMQDTEVSLGGESYVLQCIPVPGEEYVNCYGRNVTQWKKAEAALKASEKKFRYLLENLPVSVALTTPDGTRAIEPNKATLEMYGFDSLEDYRRTPMADRYADPEDRNRWIEMASKGPVKEFELKLKRKDGNVFWARRTSTNLEPEHGGQRIVVTADISRIKEAEEELKKHRNNLEELVARRTAELTRQSELVSRQAQEILEISTPVMQLWKGVLVAPLIGTLDSERTRRFMERLLQRIVDTDSGTVLVDITGVPAIDTGTAQHLIDTITAVKLLGAQVILTGVRPAIAQTLVHLGIDLTGIKTSSSLAMGLQMAINLSGAMNKDKTEKEV